MKDTKRMRLLLMHGSQDVESCLRSSICLITYPRSMLNQEISYAASGS